MLLLLPAAPAAAVSNVVRVSASSAVNGLGDKSVNVNCPPGMRLVGTGGAINSGSADVRIYQITPNAALTGLTVRALATADPSWGVTGYGVCTSIALPGLERRTFISASNSAVSKSATAVCTAGKRLLGSGGLVSGFVSNVLIDDILPHATLDRVTVWGVEGQGGTPQNWTVTAVAICASVPAIQVFRESASSASNSLSPKSATATCGSGSVLFGTGAELLNGAGQVSIQHIVPNGGVMTAPLANRVTAREDADGTGQSWQVRSYAICYVLPVT
ncbi:MAG: hypothetical protein ACT4OM_13030 [Actinomycetota bacterium]